MKKIYSILVLVFVLSCLHGFGQTIFTSFINFETKNYSNIIFIDTISNPKNIWQIGKPSKSISDSAYSPTHAIVTDTLNPYPINDTSRFIIKQILNLPHSSSSVQLSFIYKLNTDSVKDFGMIELSIDNGTTWIDLISNDTMYRLIWESNKPVLTGTSVGWKHCSFDLFSTLRLLKNYSNTLLYRITFISDSVQNNKAGWMIDDIYLYERFLGGIDEIKDNNLISIYPNPTSDNLHVDRIGNSFSKHRVIQIFNYAGQLIFENNNFKEDKIDTRLLINGIYILRYSEDEEKYALKKFVIEH